MRFLRKPRERAQLVADRVAHGAQLAVGWLVAIVAAQLLVALACLVLAANVAGGRDA